MIRKILLFWYWKQWKKYFKYFQLQWDEIYIVVKNHVYENIEWVKKIYTFSEIQNDGSFYFGEFNIIIIAVFPYDSQKNVIEFIKNKSCPNSKIIIEKPVTYDLMLLYNLIHDDRFIFFIDEIFLLQSFINSYIFSKIDSIKIILYNNQPDYYTHVLEHAIGIFFSHSDFDKLISLVSINFLSSHQEEDMNILRYKILINKKIIIECLKWEIFFNNKKIWKIDFHKVLDTVCEMIDTGDNKKNRFLKSNFYLYRNSFISHKIDNTTSFDDLYERDWRKIVWNTNQIESEILFFINNYWSDLNWYFLDVWCWYSKIPDWCVLNQKKYIWIDISTTLVEYQKRIYNLNYNINFHSIDILDFKINKSSVSCILDIWCFHFIPFNNQLWILDKYHQGLEKHGYIFIRFFTSKNLINIDNNLPLFYIENIPVWWADFVFIYNFFLEYEYEFVHIMKDTTNFIMADRLTLILKKTRDDI